jgi:hypothetical protein
MSQTVPYCEACRLSRETSAAAAKARRKGKGKVNAWNGESSEEEYDEWAGGEPGIIKVI